MRVEIDQVKVTKARDVHKVRIENKNDYLKVKWMLSRIPITWAANDTTHTLYFLGKRFLD
ncbi:MAG: hypothetical protein J5965_10085 [Aeriscardovia sp.]|nr:hypothetical protein [Aeriscardovia sp.]